MKKKVLNIVAVVVVVLAMAVVFVACSSESTKEDSKEVTSAITDTTTETTTETTIESPLKELSLNTQYTTEEYELIFKDIKFSKKCEVKTGSHSSTYYEAGEGNVLIVLETSLKNIGTETVSSWSLKPFEVTAVYDEKYNYSDYGVIADYDIQPLSEKTVCFYIEVPESVKSATESLVLNFELDSEKYLYTIR